MQIINRSWIQRPMKDQTTALIRYGYQASCSLNNRMTQPGRAWLRGDKDTR